MSNFSGNKPHVLVLGGGSAGVVAAQKLRKDLGSKVAITLVDSRPYLTFAPLLPEVASGQISPSNIIAPHRQLLKGVKLVNAAVSEIRTADKTVVVETSSGDQLDISYDYVVITLGSVPRVLPIPGLAEFGIGMKWVEEAAEIHDTVVRNLAQAATTKDADERKRLLTFTWVGGGFNGAESIAEVEDMVRRQLRHYPDLHASDVRFVLIEAMGRILPEVGEDLSKHALKLLRERGIEVKLETFTNSAVDGKIQTSDGDEFETSLLVWSAGIKPNPVLANGDLPLNKTGRLDCLADLRVKGEDGPIPGVYAAGDCTTVPDLAAGEGKFCVPNAQHATRQAKTLAENIARELDGRPLEDYYHEYMGTMAVMGQLKGVGQLVIKGKYIDIKGPLAWFFGQAYHLMSLPTGSRKIGVFFDWVRALIFGQDLIPASPASSNPRGAFIEAAQSAPKK